MTGCWAVEKDSDTQEVSPLGNWAFSGSASHCQGKVAFSPLRGHETLLKPKRVWKIGEIGDRLKPGKYHTECFPVVHTQWGNWFSSLPVCVHWWPPHHVYNVWEALVIQHWAIPESWRDFSLPTFFLLHEDPAYPKDLVSKYVAKAYKGCIHSALCISCVFLITLHWFMLLYWDYFLCCSMGASFLLYFWERV